MVQALDYIIDRVLHFKRLGVTLFLIVLQAQYMFIHDALKEFIMCGETEVLAPNLGILINKLGRTKLGITGFEQQFQVCILSITIT